MEPEKIILYYCFTPLSDPEAIKLWQRSLCEQHGLLGRILISRHGINGTLGGSMTSLKRYIKGTREFPGFRAIEFKWSEGSASDFPRLRVRVRDEIVSFGAPDRLIIDEHGVVGGGTHLTPSGVHELVDQRGGDVVFFDGRNSFEALIGRFKNAVVPDVRTTHDFARELDGGRFDYLKDKAVVTYCTGGVRCEVLSSLMVQRGFAEVYQLDGGIVRYGQEFGDRGLWEGSLYLFDARMHQEFSDDHEVIGRCERCETPTSQFHNCANLACRKLILLCDGCARDNVSTNCRPSHADLPRSTGSRTSG
ncbi:MAG TPA: rhodanese-related sulfurtransferase [Acidimicrobiales bacterium]